jgi:uncharacterized protein (DUF4415 family)
MKNITLAIDEDVLAEVRKIAAERETTVNALVREYLAELAKQRDRSAKARAELQRLSEQSQARLGPDWKFNREELYAERTEFPRHKRADLCGDRKAGRATKKREGQ